MHRQVAARPWLVVALAMAGVAQAAQVAPCAGAAERGRPGAEHQVRKTASSDPAGNTIPMDEHGAEVVGTAHRGAIDKEGRAVGEHGATKESPEVASLPPYIWDLASLPPYIWYRLASILGTASPRSVVRCGAPAEAADRPAKVERSL